MALTLEQAREVLAGNLSVFSNGAVHIGNSFAHRRVNTNPELLARLQAEARAIIADHDAKEREAKIGMGTAPKSFQPAEAVSRLEKLRTSSGGGGPAPSAAPAPAPPSYIFSRGHAPAPAFTDWPAPPPYIPSSGHAPTRAYAYLRKELTENPLLTKEEILANLKAEDVHPSVISEVAQNFDSIKPIVMAHIGRSEPNHPFNDIADAKAYLEANHYSPEDADTILAKTKANISGKFILPTDVQSNIKTQHLKELEAGFVRKATKAEEQQFRLKTTEPLEAGMTADKSRWAEDAGLIAAQVGARHLTHGLKQYQGEKNVPLQAEQLESHRLKKELDPERLERKRQIADIESNLGKWRGGDKASKAAQPYLSKASADFAKQHKDLFGDIETAHEKSLYDQGLRAWDEKMAPKIMSKYLTPGVKGHGQVAKEIGEAGEKVIRGVNESIIGQRAQNRAASIGATSYNQQANIAAAGLAGKLSRDDLTSDLEATQGLEDTRQRHQAARATHAQNVASIGEELQTQKQKDADWKYSQFEKAEKHPLKAAEFLGNLSTGNTTGGVLSEAPVEDKRGNWKRDLAGAFGGISAHAFSPPNVTKKTGGRVNKAEGGTIDPEQMAINDAVIQGTSPLYELNRYITNDARIGLLKAQANKKQRYASGGMVDLETQPQTAPSSMYANATLTPKRVAPKPAASPITSGINQARQVVAEDELTRKSREFREKMFDEPVEEVEKQPSELSGWVRAAMAGAAGAGGNSWLGKTGQSYTAAMQDLEAQAALRKEAAKEKRKEKAERDKNRTDLTGMLTGEKHKEEELGLKRSELGIHSARAQNEAAHWAAKNELYNAQANKLKGGFGMYGETLEDPDDLPKTNDPKNIKKLEELNKDLNVTKEYGNAILGAMDPAYTIDSGPAAARAEKWKDFGLHHIVSPFVAESAEALTDAPGKFTQVITAKDALRSRFNEGRASGRTRMAVQNETDAKAQLKYSRKHNIGRLSDEELSAISHFDSIINSNKIYGASNNQIKQAIADKEDFIKKCEQKRIDYNAKKIAMDDETSKTINPGKKAMIAEILKKRGVL
jgi:hypothetical protein